MASEWLSSCHTLIQPRFKLIILITGTQDITDPLRRQVLVLHCSFRLGRRQLLTMMFTSDCFLVQVVILSKFQFRASHRRNIWNLNCRYMKMFAGLSTFTLKPWPADITSSVITSKHPPRILLHQQKGLIVRQNYLLVPVTMNNPSSVFLLRAVECWQGQGRILLTGQHVEHGVNSVRDRGSTPTGSKKKKKKHVCTLKSIRSSGWKCQSNGI